MAILKTLYSSECRGSFLFCMDHTLNSVQGPFIFQLHKIMSFLSLLFGASLVTQLIKNLPEMQETTCNVGDPGLISGSARSPGEGVGDPLQYSWASLVAQMVKNPPAMQETWVQSLGWEDPLEKGKATYPA